MLHKAISASKTHPDSHNKTIVDSLREYLHSLNYNNFEFVISLGIAPGINDVKSLQNFLEDYLNSFVRSKDVQNILYTLLDEFNMNLGTKKEDIEKLLTEIILALSEENTYNRDEESDG